MLTNTKSRLSYDEDIAEIDKKSKAVAALIRKSGSADDLGYLEPSREMFKEYIK